MTHNLRFRIAFHGPFHVATGTSTAGLDRSVDRERPLPATSLKGLMRAEASERLHLDSALVDEVFGAAGGSGSYWWWGDAVLESQHITHNARIRIDDVTGTTERGFLMLGESVWADSGTFDIGQLRPLTPSRAQLHQLVLRAAAASVTSLGGQRRRGHGWVTIRPDTEMTLTECQQLVGQRRGTTMGGARA